MLLSTQNLNRSLLSILDCSLYDLSSIFEIADSGDFTIKNPGVFLSIFFENSTRTLLSFQKAALNCGFKVMNFDLESSSIAKNETEINTIRTLKELSLDAVAMRCKRSLEPWIFSKIVSPKTICVNAGDGINEHPTQALLDLYTILKAFKIQFAKNCLKDLKIAIMGDVMHSRVARSNIFLLSNLGAKVYIISPPNFLNENFASFYKNHFNISISSAYLKGDDQKYDVIMLLRVQKERIEGSGKICYPSCYGIFTEEDLNGALLMHPGPINAGVEVSLDVAFNSKQSLISNQVSNGVLIRSAILKYLRQNS